MYEVSSKSENGKMVKFRGKIFWGGISQGGGGEIKGGNLKKKRKSTNCDCKISLYTKFHSNQTMGKWSNLEGKV